jgi:hypothetical protein
VIEEAPRGTTIMTKKSILATLLDDKQSRAELELVFSSSDDDYNFNFFGGADDDDDDTILVPLAYKFCIRNGPFYMGLIAFY